MNTFRLLGGVSVAVLLAHGALAEESLQDVPISIGAVSGSDLEKLGSGDIAELLYVAPSVSVLGGGAYAPEFGAGIKIRGISGRNVNLSLEGSAALYQPGSVEELWVGSRLGFVLDEISKIEIVGSGSLGLIGGTPSYRFGVGGEIPLLPNTDLIIEGVLGGHIGFAPTDNGIRAGLHFFPGRPSDVEVLRGPQGTLFGKPSIWLGGSVSAVPSASTVIPSFDAGVKFKTGDSLDLGLSASLGYEYPSGDYSASVSGELGLQFAPQLRGYLTGGVGTIGGSFSFNRVGVGGEYQIDPNLSLVGEGFLRGPLGSLTEGGIKVGTRYTLAPESDWEDPITIDLGPSTVAPEFFLGKSLSFIPDGGYVIPSIEAGLTLPLNGTGLDTSLRGELGYVHPSGDILGLAGVDLGYHLSRELKISGGVSVGAIGGFPINRVNVGGEYKLNDNFALRGEGFMQGGLGTLSESGLKIALRYINSNLAAGD